jgi:hypothetical protein
MSLKLTLVFLAFSTIAYGQINRLYEYQEKNGKYGFIDKSGEVKIEAKYLIVEDFGDGLCFVSKETIAKGYKWICIDTMGKEVFDIQDNSPETTFDEGFARISSLMIIGL